MSERLPDPVRQTALWILLRHETRRRSIEGALRSAAASFEDRDRRFLWSLVQETIRWRARLDAVIGSLLSREMAGLDPPVRVILRLAACQICILDQVPAHAVVDEGVRLAKRFAPRGAERLVNAISRRLAADGRARWAQGEPTDDPARWPAAYSHPDWLVQRWRRRLGDARTATILRWDNERAPVWLRARPGGPAPPGEAGWVPNTYRMPPAYRPAADPQFAMGSWTAQDPGEALIGLLPPDPAAGPVLDLCAAPGTKTSHLEERFPGRVIALDRTARRVERLRDTLRRTGRTVPLVLSDASRPSLRAGCAGAVLLDAPCSNLGVLRRRVDARWNLREEDVERHSRFQGRLLRSASALPRPGGWLLYSVCSIEPEETDAVRERFLGERPDFRPLRFAHQPPDSLCPDEGVLRILPGEAECDGVYASLFERI